MTDQELQEYDIQTRLGVVRSKEVLALRERLAAAEDLCGEAILEIGHHKRSKVFNQILCKWLTIRG